MGRVNLPNEQEAFAWYRDRAADVYEAFRDRIDAAWLAEPPKGTNR
jgi:hypothetical protein